MTVQMSRAINKRSGVQQNFIADNSEIGSVASDYNGGFIGRFTRGRIDKVFPVTREKLERKLGAAVSLSVSALGEAQIQVYEALRYGTQQAIVSRMIATDAVNKLLIATATVPAEGGGAAPAVWSVGLESEDLPEGALIAFKHLDCFNDGLTCEINAEAAEDAQGVATPSKIITVQFVDPASAKVIIGPFTGSLDPQAKDEFGNSSYIGDVIDKGTDDLDVIEVASGASVPVTCGFYGKSNGKAKFSSALLNYFTEGRTVYTAAEMESAVDRLRRSRPNFTYLNAGGSENVALLSLMADLGKEINKQFPFDVPGRLSPEAAAAFVQSIGASVKELYGQAYWAPLKRANPIAGGKAFFGTSGQQIGLRCARNAQVNAKGIAPRNRVIAGSDYGLAGTGITQTHEPSDDELELLAENQINPCIFKDYPSGAKYAWVDSLTGAQTTGATKLIAVAEMATFLDDKVAAFGQETLQKPMNESITMMSRFLGTLLPAVESAKWLNGTAELDGAGWQYEVKRNEAMPYDEMMVLYDVCYDGTNRITRAQQTIVRQS
ncbi:hypothetical protein KVG88_30005 [Pseudomonas sp. SWRI74]|uniref:Phage tail protein n=1 Tax=Pseudomonas azerbaijanoccidentalis TaxID=2842347 RepID=A0ABS6QZK3_9PSED|nr:hypothetical protein [Pseudomonas azerbaijanoccidentalis]MBV4524309.1 hypothetical protein [Pseudomonas azerbaijanoccidentalis]